MGRRSVKINNLIEEMIEIAVMTMQENVDWVARVNITQEEIDEAERIMIKKLFPSRYKELVAAGIFCEEA